MKINTKYFSEIEYSDDEVVFFEKGLFGFESEKKFIIIRFNNDNNSLLCLQSINDENLAFVLLNPYNHIKDYSLDMLEKEFEELEIENDNYSTYNICVIKDDLMESTVNLKCPIIVNVETRKAQQVIMEGNKYPFKYKFSQFLK